MKFKFILTVVLFVLIISCGIIQIVIVNKTMDFISDELEVLDQEVFMENYNIDRVNSLKIFWQKRLPLLETLIPNNEIDQVAMLLAELSGAIENEDQKETNIRIEVLQTRAQSIKHLLGFRIEHIV